MIWRSVGLLIMSKHYPLRFSEVNAYIAGMSKLENAFNQVVGAIADKVADKISAGAKSRPKEKGKDKTKPNGVKKRDMRCKGVLGNGQRCRARSKGPRFRYLCEEHLSGAKRGVKTAKKKREKEDPATDQVTEAATVTIEAPAEAA